MGMYGDALSKLDNGTFVKIVPGRPVKLRLLDHPWVSIKQYDSGNNGTRFSWPVWDYALNKVRILEQGKSVFDAIANACETWPSGDQMPSSFDVVIQREGTGQFDTKYTVSTVPHAGTMPMMKDLKDQMPDMGELSKGIPLKQIIEGQQPDVVKVGSGSPTLAALEAGDAAPDDLPEGDIDLSKIPF